MLPDEFQDLTLLMEVEPQTWRGVLAAAGEASRLNGTPFSHDWLLQSLRRQEPGDKLYDALEVIVELGTAEGHELLLTVATDAQVALEGVEELPVRELAARAWLQSQSNSALGVVLVRARVNSHEIARVRACREFVGKTTKPTRSLTQQRLLAAIAEKFKESRHREALDVFIHEKNGEWRCEVLRGDAAKRVVEVREGRAGILNYQSAASDHLRYEPETARLSISTRSSRLLQIYRQIMGTLLAKDSVFFADENICSLKPLQQQGRELFEQHQMHEIWRVDVVELRWRKGDLGQLIVRGRDCFQVLHGVEARLNEGELIEAKLSIAFAGQARRGHVAIKVPNRIEIKAGAKKPLVEQLLDQVGIRGAFWDGERQDFWSLHPWRMTAQAWRQHVGADFDELVRRRKVLRPTRLDAVTHPNHPASVGALKVEHVDGVYVGFSEDPAIGIRTLTSSDIEGYEPAFSQITKDIVDALDLEGTVSEPTSGLWSLGRRELVPGTPITVFLASRRPSEAAALVVREASKKRRVVLLVPRDCSCELDVVQLGCRLPNGPYDELFGRVVEELGLQDEVSPALRFGEDLILDEQNGAAWYRRVELKLALHPFRFAVAVARAKGGVVTTDHLNEVLSPARTDGAAAKQAKSDFLKTMKTSFAAAGQEYPAEAANQLFVPVRGGYKLHGSARVL